MSFGLLGSVKLSAGQTEYEVYQAPSSVKAVGTIVITNSHLSQDHRVSVFVTSVTGSVSGMLNTALLSAGIDFGFLMSGGLCKYFGSDDGVPVVISGVVIGPSQRIVVYDHQTGTFSGTQSVLVSFNGIEEGV
jgi:hypothetical protein